MTTIGFLHTAHSHAPLFDDIARELAPGVQVIHQSEPGLLAAVTEHGLTAEVLQGVNDALAKLIKDGAEVISCTCSTLGPLVEGRVLDSVSVLRIDRAAADSLMDEDRVLVLAALESAAEAADELLRASSERRETGSRWVVVLVPGAWEKFQAGDLQGYWDCVSEYANRFVSDYDVVFLSQASMAGAAANCRHGRVVTTPVPGVEALLKAASSTA